MLVYQGGVGLVFLVSRGVGTLAEDQILPGGADLCVEGQGAHRGMSRPNMCACVSEDNIETGREAKGERRCMEVGR
jgi:hypothetical protein